MFVIPKGGQEKVVQMVTQAETAMLAIRPAQPQDYGAIASIYNESIAHGGITMDGRFHTSEDVATMVQTMTPRETLLVADNATTVIGWGKIKRYSDRIGYQRCCETSIYLTFSETDKGYGSILQKALMTQVNALGYHHVVAKILAANQGSVQFHQRFGFEIVGIQKEIGFINNRWQDVVILQCILPRPLDPIAIMPE